MYDHERWSESAHRGFRTKYCDCPHGNEAKLAWDRDQAETERIQGLKRKCDDALRRCNIAKRFAEISVDDIDSPKVQMIARAYYDEWPERQEKGQGLYFWGGVGSGKTFTALAVANDLRRNRYAEMMYFNFAEMMYRIRQSFDGAKGFDPRTMENIKRCELLVIDDIGLEKATEWITEQLYLVVNHRYEQLLPTIITSNQSPEDLAKLHNEQIASRFKEMSTVVKFTGKDRRESKPLTAR